MNKASLFAVAAVIAAALVLGAGPVLWIGCGDPAKNADAGEDSGGVEDTGTEDGGEDAGETDAYSPPDASDSGLSDVFSPDASDAGKKDGGVDAGDAGPKPDAGKVGTIIPGTGIQLWTTDSTKKSLTVLTDTYKDVKTALGTGEPDTDVPFYVRWYNWSVDGFFVNSAGGDSLVDLSTLNQVVLGSGFNGQTASGHRPGSSRAGWQSELGTPNNSYTNIGGETVDLYFKTVGATKQGGISIVYDGSNIAKQVTVFKETKEVPGEDIAWDIPSVFSVNAGVTSGTSFTDVMTKFGSPDIDSTKTAGGVEIRSLTYIQLGLTFSGAKSSGTVGTIAIIAPYFGKLKYGTLKLGALHSDITTFFSGQTKCCNTADDCKSTAKCTESVYEIDNGGKKVNVYYYKIKMETVLFTSYYITVGFIYSDTAPYTDQATSILLGFPIKK
jgi:hypothetical protein